MNIESIDIKHLQEVIKYSAIIRKKRERTVLLNNDFFYKVWVPNWTQGDVTKHALDVGFYNENNASALVALIHDNSGQRGYVCKKGDPFSPQGSQDWNYFNQIIEENYRAKWMYELLATSLKCGGMYVDLVSSNMLLTNNKISLIDLDSYSSFEFIFDSKRQWYERFELDAWWKPFETISRDVDAFYKDYFNSCLDIRIEEKINSIDVIMKMMKSIEDKYGQPL
tara:strand:+ start:2619 stop:3290 length:672 start_codon:yes stop_codon:yes gene_type:complete